MSTDPREFEHPIDGTGGTVPPLVDVIAEALESHLGMERETWNIDPEYFRGQARAVLAALEGAGHVEWGTGEGDALMTWRDRGQAERQSASATRSTDGGKTWQHTNPPVVSRITGPWTAVEE